MKLASDDRSVSNLVAGKFQQTNEVQKPNLNLFCACLLTSCEVSSKSVQRFRKVENMTSLRWTLDDIRRTKGYDNS